MGWFSRGEELSRGSVEEDAAADEVSGEDFSISKCLEGLSQFELVRLLVLFHLNKAYREGDLDEEDILMHIEKCKGEIK